MLWLNPSCPAALTPPPKTIGSLIISLPSTGTPSGDEVRTLIADLLNREDSKLMAAVRNTAEKLKLNPQTMHLNEWSDCLFHWATMMEAGYKLHATDTDRKVFAEHARFYVLRKTITTTAAGRTG